MIDADDVIDLVLGLNPDTDAETYVPNVIGKRYTTAVDAVHKQSLNIKTLRFDDSVKDYDDSLNAVVYRQSPEASPLPVNLGNDVSLYLTVNPERIPSR